MNEKYIELAKKLKALADRGVGGEKINAHQQLKKIMAKYGISEEDLNDLQTSVHEFKKPKPGYATDLFFQVAVSVMDGEAGVRYQSGKRRIYIEITYSQFIEITCKYDFYLKAFERDLDLFCKAFIQRNKIFKPSGTSINPNELSPKEREEAKKLINLAAQLEEHQFVKQINQ